MGHISDYPLARAEPHTSVSQTHFCMRNGPGSQDQFVCMCSDAHMYNKSVYMVCVCVITYLQYSFIMPTVGERALIIRTLLTGPTVPVGETSWS